MTHAPTGSSPQKGLTQLPPSKLAPTPVFSNFFIFLCFAYHLTLPQIIGLCLLVYCLSPSQNCKLQKGRDYVFGHSHSQQ